MSVVIKTATLKASVLVISGFLGIGLTACSEDKSADDQQTENQVSSSQEHTAKLEETNATQVPQKVETQMTPIPEPMVEALPPVEETIPEKATDEPQEPVVAPANDTANTAAQKHEVKAAVTQFNPAVIFVNPGDTVIWTNMAGHDTASFDGMIPDGAEAWHSNMGEQFSLTFTQEGAYVYKCTPHASLGMIGAIIVGQEKPANLEKINSHPENKGMVARAIRQMNKALDER